MVKLEIRNLESSKAHLVDPAGAVLGREGGDAQIKLSDQGVSKKHARIYAKRGTWYLEDLDSANGTYLEDERITSPVVLTPGAVFTMSRQQFEVVQIVTEEPEPTRNPRDANPEDMDHAETNAMEPGDLPDRLRGQKGKRPAGKSKADLRGGRVEDEPPPTDHSTSARRDEGMDDRDDAPAARRGKASEAGGGGRGVQSAARGQSSDADVPAPSFAYFATAVPRAVAYYLKSVPLMAVNPLGTIRKGIAEQPLPALSNVELIAYAFPALLFSGLVTAVCTAILAIRTGTFTIGMLFPIGPLIGAVVGAVVGGLIAHPVLTWLVDKLEGQSDARSRSNMFVMQMTATALLALPGGLAVLFGLIPLPFVNLVPLLISVVASLVALFLLFSWFRYFGVVQWFEYVILGLGALLVLNAAYGLVTTTIATFQGGGAMMAGSGGTAPIPMPGDSPAMAAARQTANELIKAGDSEGARRVLDAAEKAEKAAAAAGDSNPSAAAAPANPPPTESPAPTSPAAAAATPASGTAPAAGTPAAGSGTPEPSPPPAAAAAANPPPSAPTAAAATETPAPPAPAPVPSGKGKPSYPEYRAMRTAVEKAINDDPTLIRRKDVLSSYRELLTLSRAAEDKVKLERGPAAAVIAARQREADVYDATWRTVMDLHRQIFK